MSGAYSILDQADELRTRRKEGDVLVPTRDVTLALGGCGVTTPAEREQQLRLAIVHIRHYAEAAVTGVPRGVLIELCDHALAGDLL